MFVKHRFFYLLSTLIILIVTAGLTPDWIQYGMFYVGGDFAHQQVPFIIETKRMFASGAPWWSWNTFWGDNFIAAYSYYTLTSLFAWINCLFPYEWILQSITLTIYLKFLCTGWFSYAYFRKMKVSERMSLAGGLMYTFSSFVISNITYYTFLESLMFFPLLLISIEKYLGQERHGASALMGASFLVAFINWYFIPCSFLAAFFYTLCRITSREIRMTWRKIALGGMLMVGGVLMSSIVLLPTLLHTYNSQRASVEFCFNISSWEMLLWLQRLRSMVFPDIWEGFNPMLWLSVPNQSNESYVPIMGILPAVLYIIQNRRDWLSKLIVLASILYITPFNGLFSLFTNPYYSRWVYAFVLFLILATVKFLDSKQVISNGTFFKYMIFVGGVCLISYFPVFYNFVKGINNFSIADIVLNVILLSLLVLGLFFLFLYCRSSSYKLLISLLGVYAVLHLSFSIYARTDWFYSLSDNKSKQYIIKQSIHDDLPRGEQNFHSRIDTRRTDGYEYFNLSLLKNRPSLSTYHSVRNRIIETLIETTDTFRRPSNSFSPLFNRISFDALMSVSEIVDYGNLQSQKSEVSAKDHSQYSIYGFSHYIPMGFTYDTYIPESKVTPLLKQRPLPDVPLQLLANLVLKDEDVSIAKKYLRKGTLVKQNTLDSVVNERRRHVCSSFQGDTRGFKADITLERDNYVFFSVPADPGFIAYIDGKEKPIIAANFGLSAVLVPKGFHHIDFRFLPRGLKTGLIISIIMMIVLVILYTYENRSFSSTY